MSPACAAGKNGHVVDHQLEAVARRAAVCAQLSEADAPELDHFIVSEFERNAMQHRLAMRMRPPARGIGYAQRSGTRLRIAPLQRGRCIVAGKSGALFALRMDKPNRQMNEAIVAIEAGMQVHAIDRRRRFPQQLHRPPWTCCLYRRAPAGHVAEQCRAYIAQCCRLSEPWPPACTRAFGGERGTQRTKAEIERGVSVQMQIKIVRAEHRT